MRTVGQFLAATAMAACAAGADTYGDAARQAGDWLDRQPLAAAANLYAGKAGVAVYYLELHRAGGGAAALAKLEAIGDSLIADAPKENGAGLYEGSAGVAFALAEIGKATGRPRFRDAAAGVVETIRRSARPAGGGVAWGDSTDIISGAAGTGLFLLYAARELKVPAAKDTAIQAGVALLARGRKTEHGIEWPMDSKFPRLMPNFSHGTAGVAYFLASLYLETKDKRFLDAALAGAKHLLAIADKEGGVCRIYHHTPDGLDLFYLGWCHGPTGTARLFYRLYQATGDRAWMDWVTRSANALLASGIPEKQTPGFWNNAGQCCGLAGVGEFSLALYRVTKDAKYLEFARKLTDNLLARGTGEEGGLKWVHAEHRTQPSNLAAQTGYMQGAAGIGAWLLRLSAAERGRPSTLTFPDSPF